jgi:hypothetical protein
MKLKIKCSGKLYNTIITYDKYNMAYYYNNCWLTISEFFNNNNIYLDKIKLKY